jgi:hypothetical protein
MSWGAPGGGRYPQDYGGPPPRGTMDYGPPTPNHGAQTPNYGTPNTPNYGAQTPNHGAQAPNNGVPNTPNYGAQHPNPWVPTTGYGVPAPVDLCGFTVFDHDNPMGPRTPMVHYEEERLRGTDERDAVQKKTFTKWVNKHLLKAGRHIIDLYDDLKDGHNLISLLEVLAHDLLPRERGHMRFHKIQNVQIALDFLRVKGIKLVNIRSDEIVDGNPKLTLGLIWTIILHFQVRISFA